MYYTVDANYTRALETLRGLSAPAELLVYSLLRCGPVPDCSSVCPPKRSNLLQANTTRNSSADEIGERYRLDHASVVKHYTYTHVLNFP